MIQIFSQIADIFLRSVAPQVHARFRERKGLRKVPELLEQIADKLREEQWSLEQISATFAENGLGRVSNETIYQHIYRDTEAGGKLYKHLRHHCKSYRKRGSKCERRDQIKNQVMINKRPLIV